MKIFVTEIERSNSGGAFQGHVSMVIPELKLKLSGVAWNKIPGGRSWFNLPIKRYTNSEGEQKINQLVSFTGKGTFRMFETSLIRAIQHFEKKGGVDHDN